MADVEGLLVDEGVASDSEQSREQSPDPFALELDEDQEAELFELIERQFMDVEHYKEEARPRIDRYRRQRINRPEHDGPKDTPYPNSSNVMPPVTMSLQNTVYSTTLRTVSKRPFWKIESYRTARDVESQQLLEEAKVLTRYYNMLSESPRDLALPKKQRVIHYESTSMGSAYVYVPWKRMTKTIKRVGPLGEQQVMEMVLKDGPDVEWIEWEDFYPAREFDDVDEMPAVFHALHLPWNTIAERESDGTYLPTEGLEVWVRKHRSTDEASRDERKRETVLPTHGLVDLLHGFVFLDVDGDGIYEDVEFTVHLKSRTVLRLGYNSIGYRPFATAIHLIQPGDTDGIGVCAAADYMQQEAESIHNMRIDNMKLANQRIFKARKGGGVKANERIFAGKILFLDEMDDFRAEPLADIYPSSERSEMLAMQYAQRAAGAPDGMSGFADSVMKSGDTAAGQIFRVEQGQGIQATIAETHADFYARLGMLIFLRLVENKDVVVENEQKIGRLTEEELELLRSALEIPLEDVPMKFQFRIRVSKADETYDVKRQNYTTLSQIVSMFYEKITPVVELLYGPQAQQMPVDLRMWFSKMLTGSQKLLEEILTFFGIEDLDEYLPDTSKEEEMQNMFRELEARMKQMEGAMNGQPGISDGQVGGGPQAIGGPVGPGGGVQGGGGEAVGEAGPVGGQAPGGPPLV